MTVEKQISSQDESGHHSPVAVDLYFNEGRYYMKDNRGIFKGYSKDDMKGMLKMMNCCGSKAPKENLSDVDKALATACFNAACEYAGPLAGYPVGVRDFGGDRVLVTKGPKIIKAENKPFPVLEGILTQLFQSDYEPQLPYVFGWLKAAREMMHAQTAMPGQCLVLAGPRNSGKSLFQDLVTQMLGGRAGLPYRYISGGTEFNRDLFEKEHLMIADQPPKRDIDSRRRFGSKIKDITVNHTQSLHAKHKDALELEPCWRLTVSLNSEEENLNMLPPLDDSIRDKIMLFKVAQTTMPMESHTPSGRKQFWKTLMDELPGFLWFVENYEIPEPMRDDRFAVKAYHHPDIVEALSEMSPESQLDELIEAIILPASESWQGTLMDLQTQMLDDLTYKSRVDRLLRHPGTLKKYMRRLHKDRPNRYAHTKSHGKHLWTVNR